MPCLPSISNRAGKETFFHESIPPQLVENKKKTYRTTSSGGIFFFLCFPDSSVHFRRKPGGIFSCRSSIERSINQIQCKYFEIHSFNCHLAAGRRRHSNDLTTQTAGQCSAKKGEKVSPHHKKTRSLWDAKESPSCGLWSTLR